MQAATQSDSGNSATFSERDALWPNYSPPRDLVFTHGLLVLGKRLTEIVAAVAAGHEIK